MDAPEKIVWRNFGYKYPRGANFKPDSETHSRLIAYLIELATGAKAKAQEKFSAWRAIDDSLQAYIPLSAVEQKVRAQDSREPMPVVVPESLAIRDVFLSYLVSVFISDPMFRYVGVGPEDIVAAIKMEKVVDIQARNARVPLRMHSMWSNAITYGRGAVHPYWHVQRGKKVIRKWNYNTVEALVESSFVPRSVKRYLNKKKTIDVVKCEGTHLTTLNPYAYFPDPASVAGEVNSGRFVAWVDRTSYQTLLENELTNPDQYFNVKHIQDFKSAATSTFYSSEAAGNTSTGAANSGEVDPIADILYVSAKLIPFEWKIGTSKEVERWMFGIVGDRLIVIAHPIEDVHGGLGICEIAPDYDGLNTLVTSKLESIFGLQTYLNFKFNSDMLRDRMDMFSGFLVDPMLVNTDDMLDPSPGMIVRTLESMWGKGLENALQPLPGINHPNMTMQSVPNVLQLMRDMSGAVDPVRGVRRQRGERVTAEEIKGDRGAAISRLAKMAIIASYQGHRDLASIYADNTQQYMSEDVWIQTLGRDDDILREEFGYTESRIKVTPYDVLTDYNLYSGDNSLSGNEDVETMVKIFQMISSQPMLMQGPEGFDLHKFVRAIARASGFTHINDFITRAKKPQMPQLQPRVERNEAVRKQVQAGNYIPVEEAEDELTEAA